MEPSNPISIFDLDYFDTTDEAQAALDQFPVRHEKVLHLPSHQDIIEIRKKLQEKAEGNGISNRDVLFAYQELSLSASSSDIICCEVANGHRCGGLMDVEVSVFGAYYQCRKNSTHRFPV